MIPGTLEGRMYINFHAWFTWKVLTTVISNIRPCRVFFLRVRQSLVGQGLLIFESSR